MVGGTWQLAGTRWRWTDDRQHEAIIKVERLEKRFPVSAGLFRKPKSFIHAVDDLNFEIPLGSSLGLVGESGCGKTTTGKLIVKLYEDDDRQTDRQAL